MLYIFHVDTGTMMTFDMNLALESVSHLQNVINNLWRIPVEKQVLLVSGGESLDPSARVCTYSAGTDTNPIYLFSKSVIESTNPPIPSIDQASDCDFKDKVEASINMPATYSTVGARSQLAQSFCDVAKEQTKICEKLVHDQHLQQQGWAAVVANLEDITVEFKARSDKFQNSFKQYMEMRDNYLQFLQNFNNDLVTLSKIPILPALQLDYNSICDTTTEITSTDSTSTNDDANSSSNTNTNTTIKTQTETNTNENVSTTTISRNKPTTLLQWISAADDQSSLDQVAEQCTRGLEQLDSRVIESLCADVKSALEAANNLQMKEVKGLGDRLYGLEQLMCESKKYVQEQSDLAQAFLQNQNRASNLGDPSILPDLCASHRRQLLVMLENHQKLRDIRRRCTRAKEELSVNLYHRLKWIMYVENLILETDHKLMIYHESLKRLRRHVEIIQQIHLAPAMYLNAVAEVVRRRAFSQAFLLWASELACHILTIHNDEVTRRKEFQTQFEGHFLNTLFPGLEDLPPSFATQAPSIFDSRLPKLTTDDVERLKCELPELAQNISVPDVSAITQFFFIKSVGKDEKVDERAVEDKLVQAVSDVGLASNLDRGLLLKTTDNETFLSAHAGLPPHLKDLDKGCESETDTEEFEKVGQSPLELQFETTKCTNLQRTGGSRHDVSTLTEVGLYNNLPPKKPPRMFLKTSIVDSQTNRIILNDLEPNTTVQNFYQDSGGGGGGCTAVLQISTCVQHNCPQQPQLPQNDIIARNTAHDYFTRNSCSIGDDSGYSNNSSMKKSISLIEQTQQQQQLLLKKSVSLTSPYKLSCKMPNSYTKVIPAVDATKCDTKDSLSLCSPCSSQGHQNLEFVTDEFYIDESMPSSLSIEGTSSQGELSRQLEQANNVIALFQDNLTSSKMEADKMRSLLIQMSVLAKDAIINLKTELIELKMYYKQELSRVKSHCSAMNTEWRQQILDLEVKHREALQRLTVDHELEQSDLKKLIQNKSEEIQGLRKENCYLETSLHKARENTKRQKEEYERILEERTTTYGELMRRVEHFTEEKERAIKDAKDDLSKEYKAEIDSIRSRFKLFTLKDRSPSDSSLEKIDHNVIEVSKHMEIVQQLRDDLASEKEKAVNEAVQEEKRSWEVKLEQELTQSRIRSEQEKQVLFNEAMRRVLDEKEKQIEVIRERCASLNMECNKYKNTIQQLTDCEDESNNSILQDKVEALQRDKCQLEAELSMERSRRLNDQPPEMVASVAVYEGKCDAATSPTRSHKLTHSQTSLIQAGKINIASCSVGDAVLVVWDTVYKNYVILQESNTLFFLHSECVDLLGLKHVQDQERRLYVTAEVVNKEYCHARKAENRYHVPKGTKFYRIKVKPLPHSKDLIRSQQHQCSMHASSMTTTTVMAAVALSSQSTVISPTTMSQSQSADQTSSVILNRTTTESQSVPTSPTKETTITTVITETETESGEEMMLYDSEISKSRIDEGIGQDSELSRDEEMST